jgi:hypothetical protein
MSVVEFTVGTSFNVPIAYTPVADLAPASLANTTITSHIREKGGRLVCALAVTKAVDNMSFTLLATDGTAAWPFDLSVFWDIKLVDTVFGAFFSDKTELKLTRPETR